jgi:uncharacterized protein YggT (Ycf19 family)
LLNVNTAKKISLWILAMLLLTWVFFPDGFGGDHFQVNVMLAALGTLTLWVTLVVLASWVFGVVGSLTRWIRNNYRPSSIPISLS